MQKQPQGFIALIGKHIGGLFVDPAAQRCGVGRALVEHAAGRLGTLTVDVYERIATAIAFYRGCGFVPVDRRERDEEGRDFALLTLRLNGLVDRIRQ